MSIALTFCRPDTFCRERSQTRRWGMFPMVAPEMVKARVEELRREGDARARRAGAAAVDRRVGLRAALGVRLVWRGCRLLGEPVRIERAEVG
jgi:uncharacterized protein YjeT (DUF2065 family)